ncbi:MAG: Hsp20/alpha crystallin family protein [Acidimicrobiia bacterium]
MTDRLEGSGACGDALADFLPRRWLEWLDWPVVASMRNAEQVLRVEEFRENRDFVVRAEIPGIDPDQDLDLQVRDHVLEIRAQRAERGERETNGGYRSEFRYGSFFRAVALPINAKEADVNASYHDGILEVRIPVEASSGPTGTRIPVEH